MSDDLKTVLASIEESVEYFGVELTDVNQRGQFGNTPLKVASVRGDVDAVRVLLSAGAEIGAVVEDGFTALHHAAAQGHLAVVRFLLERGASTDIRNDDGKTPRDLANIVGEIAVVQLLETYSRV